MVALGLAAWPARRSRPALAAIVATSMALPFLVRVEPWPARMVLVMLAGALLPFRVIDLAVAPAVDFRT